jgi:hypothetical protein
LPHELRPQPHARLLYRSFQIDQVILTHPNPSLPLAPGSTGTGTPYTIPLNDLHNNVNHHALALAGLSALGSNDSKFRVQIIGAAPTVYLLALALFGISSYSRLQFFLLLVGNEATTYL